MSSSPARPVCHDRGRQVVLVVKDGHPGNVDGSGFPMPAASDAE